jgi:hypothetical protein
MKFYVSKTNNTLNRSVFLPELINHNICLNPARRRRVKVMEGTNVLLDSGAFQDVKSDQRLSFEAALDRQLQFERDQGFISEMIVSYDHLVDEKNDEQLGRIKQRAPYDDACQFVEETIDAAKFLVDHRNDLRPRKLILSNQGVTVPQYVECVKEILSFSEEQDVIGFGGFCITGRKPSLKKDYYAVLEETLPLIRAKGIRRLHLFGIGSFDVLVRTHFLCKSYGIEPSYDTSSYEFRGLFGEVANPSEVVSPIGDSREMCPLCNKAADLPDRLEKMKLTKTFFKEDKYSLYPPVDLALFNIKLVSFFWNELNKVPVPLRPNSST